MGVLVSVFLLVSFLLSSSSFLPSSNDAATLKLHHLHHLDILRSSWHQFAAPQFTSELPPFYFEMTLHPPHTHTLYSVRSHDQLLLSPKRVFFLKVLYQVETELPS